MNVISAIWTKSNQCGPCLVDQSKVHMALKIPSLQEHRCAQGGPAPEEAGMERGQNGTKLSFPSSAQATLGVYLPGALQKAHSSSVGLASLECQHEFLQNMHGHSWAGSAISHEFTELPLAPHEADPHATSVVFARYLHHSQPRGACRNVRRPPEATPGKPGFRGRRQEPSGASAVAAR